MYINNFFSSGKERKWPSLVKIMLLVTKWNIVLMIPTPPQGPTNLSKTKPKVKGRRKGKLYIGWVLDFKTFPFADQKPQTGQQCNYPLQTMVTVPDVTPQQWQVPANDLKSNIIKSGKKFHRIPLKILSQKSPKTKNLQVITQGIFNIIKGNVKRMDFTRSNNKQDKKTLQSMCKKI